MTQKYPLIEDDAWEAMTLRQKLEHYISTVPNIVDDYQDLRTRNDFWTDVLDLGCSGYNSEVDDAAIAVIERMMKGPLQARTVQDELISYILCDAGLGEYGTSPRGAWIDHDIRDLMPAVIERWKRDWNRA